MAEQLVKLFQKEIQKGLFPDNAFYKLSKLDGGININAATVQIPQRGTGATVSVNPSSFPLTAAQRTDDVKEYNVDLYHTSPTHILDKNELEVNYNKRADILEDHVDNLNTRIADDMGYNWAATAATIATTGANRAAGYVGATGNRKAVTYDDLQAVCKQFDIDNIPMEGRYGLLTPTMFQDIMKLDEFISIDYMKEKPVSSGLIGEIFGIKLFKRSKVLRYNTGNTAKKQLSSAVVGTDNEGALFWHKNFVRRAEGNAKIYSDNDNPLYLGSIINAAVRAGGMSGRTNGEGVISLVEAPGA